MTTSTITTGPLGGDPPTTDPIASASSIRHLLGQQREAGDQRRQLTDEAVTALADAGQFRTQVAAQFGGLECDLGTVLDATAEIAKGDPAAGWVVMILGCADWLTGLFPDQAQREVYQDGPDTRVCAVMSPNGRTRQVPGGWLVDGRWSPSSGCQHAQWAILGMAAADRSGAPEQPMLALVPMAELTIDDTWRTLGMRGTASNTLTGRALFVPTHRVMPLGPAVDGLHPGTNPGSLFRSALVPTLATHMMAPYLGMAQAALEYVLHAAPRRPLTFTHYARKADSTTFQVGIAEAATRIDAARALAHRAACLVDGHAANGSYPCHLERARIRGWSGYVVAECRAAVDLLASAHGAAAFADHGLLSALVRDIHTASSHAMANPEINAEIYGKALLDITPNISGLI
jgi:3-hydroxy-9,10-secoandrosta-1,3,5(10)-triene-9,17-dione monooxygenase